ncbi:uncharacterized protein TRIADDRAFT_60224 [Trichoplax adhaerens]|uniref:Uncharacterized protein n=1 Tax=Trichoplax adhaerens TaxID=10228 RepID=B3S7M6_TRIAD|nr:hypothetical protein TRIADDRAFT_60224 [Trichoplax adhaerens]EDV21224.1 hypothetical protein TRIADDRAFT_60224 [Trichoplax adhaerens]|eukprot:XP_002116191.1 hypothetical protein TRIADDRAFT_60224 [Trichoplax adhaerens]
MASHSEQHNKSLGDYLKEVSDGLMTLYNQNDGSNRNEGDPTEEIPHIGNAKSAYTSDQTTQNKSLSQIAANVLSTEEYQQHRDINLPQEGTDLTAVEAHGNDGGQDNDTNIQQELYDNVATSGHLLSASGQAMKDSNRENEISDNHSGNISGDVAHLEDVRYQLQNAMKSAEPSNRLLGLATEKFTASGDNQLDALLNRVGGDGRSIEDAQFSIDRHDWLSSIGLDSQHCESQIYSLNAKLLEIQQQLAVARSSERKKDMMIEQLDKSVGSVLEKWKLRDAERTESIKRLTNERDTIRQAHLRQQEVLSKFEQDMAQAVEAFSKEQKRANQAEKEKQIQVQKLLQEREHINQEKERHRMLEVERNLIQQNLEAVCNEKSALEKLLEEERLLRQTMQQDWSIKEDKLKDEQRQMSKEAKGELDKYKALFKEAEVSMESADNEIHKLKNELDTSKRAYESLKVEMSLMEAEHETSLSKQRTDIVSELELQLSTKLKETEETAVKNISQLRDNHKQQIVTLKDKHKQEIEALASEYSQEMTLKANTLKTTIDDYEGRLQSLQNRLTEEEQYRNERERQRNDLMLRLQTLMQSHCNEAVKLIGDLLPSSIKVLALIYYFKRLLTAKPLAVDEKITSTKVNLLCNEKMEADATILQHQPVSSSDEKTYDPVSNENRNVNQKSNEVSTQNEVQPISEKLDNLGIMNEKRPLINPDLGNHHQNESVSSDSNTNIIRSYGNDLSSGSYSNNYASSKPNFTNSFKISNFKTEKLADISRYLNTMPRNSQDVSDQISTNAKQNNQTRVLANSINSRNMTPTKQANTDLILNILDTNAANENNVTRSNIDMRPIQIPIEPGNTEKSTTNLSNLYTANINAGQINAENIDDLRQNELQHYVEMDMLTNKIGDSDQIGLPSGLIAIPKSTDDYVANLNENKNESFHSSAFQHVPSGYAGSIAATSQAMKGQNRAVSVQDQSSNMESSSTAINTDSKYLSNLVNIYRNMSNNPNQKHLSFDNEANSVNMQPTYLSETLGGYEQQDSSLNFRTFQHPSNFQPDHQMEELQPLSDISIQYPKGNERNYPRTQDTTSRHQQPSDNIKAAVGFNPISPPERKRPYKQHQSKQANTSGRETNIVHTRSSASKVSQRSVKTDKKASGVASRSNKSTAWR